MDKFWNFIIYSILTGWLGGLIAYKISNEPYFKLISNISLTIAILPFILLFFFFFISFTIYCLLCLIPGGNKKSFFIFGEDGTELPWWGAIIWLVVTIVFLKHAIPTVIKNIGIKLCVISEATVSIGSTIDQTTFWGMFQAWVIGERTIVNSIVSWSIIIVSIAILWGGGAIVKKAWDLKNKD